MDTTLHRTSKKASPQRRESCVSRPNDKKRSKNDQYVAIWVLSKLGWTNRRIARLRLPTSHHTVSDYYSEGCELINSGKLPILAKSEKALRVFSAGKSDDVAYLFSKVHQNPCGGGKKTKQINYDDEEQD